MKTNWYKEAVVYQIYPLSYMDSNNDGIGDIPGIISRLDYIRDLGANVIWFSPLYASPWKDYGYDISDYKSIHPAFGTMDDFDELVKTCHDKGIRVMMDMVLNHTSDQHEWFKAALADPESPYREYYIIRKGRTRKGRLLPPTNWTSSFTGPAWERIGDTDEYYLHLFAREQPDLNWENPAVRQEIVDVLKFWLDKGVDGFRFDVFNLYSKVYPMKDDRNPLRFQKGTPSFVDGPRMHEVLQELNEKALSLYDTYTVGESYTPDPEHAHKYIKEESGELDTIFDFEHLASDNVGGMKFIPKPFDLKQFKKGLLGPQLRYHGTGWNTLVLENHDCVRSVSRFGINTEKYRYQAATFLAMITFLGWGTPFIYQGEEIGMTNTVFSSIDEMMDPVTHFVFETMKSLHVPARAATGMIKSGARDHARVPMAWNGSVNGGFNSGANPWQSVNTFYREINAEEDMASGHSIYRFYQELLRIRKAEETLLYGQTVEYYPDSKSIISYSRSHEGKRFLIAGNFSARERNYVIPPDFALDELMIRLSNYGQPAIERSIKLRPYEALLFEEVQK